MSDTSEIDAAILSVLNGDAALRALVPDGWYYGVAPPNSKRFGVISRVPDAFGGDVAVFGGRAYEDAGFLIKAVMLSSEGGDIKSAAARVDVLLEDVPLVVAGYRWMTTHRTDHVRMTETDEQDASIRWLHRGGRYRVQMYRGPGASPPPDTAITDSALTSKGQRS